MALGLRAFLDLLRQPVFRGKIRSARFRPLFKATIMQSCPQCQSPNSPQATFCNRCGGHLRSVHDPFVDRILGKYQLKEQIGGGGFGMVYRAEHVELGNPFAVKILHPHFLGQEAMVERFRREARLLASLRHEHIVQIIDFGFVQSLGFYLVMEWLEGQTLHQFIKSSGLPSRATLASIFENLLLALHYAHSKGIIHRDLKPENLLLLHGLGERRTLKILDFGVARMLDESGERRLTETGLAVGTPRYMAPEQAVGDLSKIDHRTDLYACGVLLTELLTGRPPFSGSTNDILLQHIERPPPLLRDLAPHARFSDDLETVVQQALAKSPFHRFATGADFASALLRALSHDLSPFAADLALNPSPSLHMPWPPASPSLSSHPSPPRPPSSFVQAPPHSHLRPTAALPVSPASLSHYGSQPSLPGYPSQLHPRDFGTSSPDSETRSLTAAPTSLPPTADSPLAPLSPSEPRTSGSAWKGEAHSPASLPSELTPLASPLPPRFHVLWSSFGILGGLLVASIFFFLGTQQRGSDTRPLASESPSRLPILVSRPLPPPPGFSSLPPPPPSPGTSGTSVASDSASNPGLSGASGTPGASDSAANPGLSGTSGASGASGSAATSGRSGTSGASGASGASGSAANPGLSGASGASGASGSAANPGLSGTSGASGASGSAANPGLSGTSGASGSAANPGLSGTSGASGASGTSGASGSAANPGLSGFLPSGSAHQGLPSNPASVKPDLRRSEDSPVAVLLPPDPRISPRKRPFPRPKPLKRRPLAPPVPRAASTSMVILHLHTIPPGAAIFVDKVPQGITPKSLPLRKGQKVQIRLQKSGFLSHNFTWKAEDEDTRKIRLAEDIF